MAGPSLPVVFLSDYTTVKGEGGYEYASNHHGGSSGNEEAHVEPAVLYQPLSNESGEAPEAESGGAVMVPVLGRPHCKSCKKHHRPAPRRGEGQEWCEFVGGAIGGFLGTPGGWGGSAAGGAAGAAAGKRICKE